MRVLSLALLLVAVTAQVNHEYARYQPRQLRQFAPVIELPQQDNARLRREEVTVGKMFTFGTIVPINTTLADGAWMNVDGGRVWSLSFHSQGAYSMNLHLARFHVPEGAAAFFYGDDSELQGAYTHESNNNDGEFGNWPLNGESVTIEFFLPSEVTELPIIEVSHAVHGYRKNEKACLGSGSCNVNAVCDPDFGNTLGNQIRGAGILLNGAGNGYCSGSMINTIGNTGRQYFLTAAHCGTSHTAIGFNWKSPQCTPTTCPAITDRAGNLSVRIRQTESDFTLVEIGEQIPASYNLFLSGFSASTVPANSMACVHHPSGDVMKISFAYKSPTPDRWSGGGPSTHWRVASWDLDTTTEPGSSGSPLFNQNGQIIGQLHGGAAACPNSLYDTYGGVYYSFNDGLSQFLDPLNTGAIETAGVNL